MRIKIHLMMSTGVLEGDGSLKEVGLWVCALEEDIFSFLFPLSVFFHLVLSPSLPGSQEVHISTKSMLCGPPPHSGTAQPAGWRLKTEPFFLRVDFLQ